MYSGGSLRLVATAAAIILGVVVCRRRYDLPTVLFVMALAFTLRVVLETELLGFYFFPVVALALVLTLRHSWALFWACAATSFACLALGNQKVHHIAVWWPAIMATTLALVAMAAVAWRREAITSEVAHTVPRRGVLASTPSHVRIVDRARDADQDQNAGATVV